MEGLEADVDWKGWIRTLLLEGTSIGRVGSGWKDVDRKGVLLLEDNSNEVAGRVGKTLIGKGCSIAVGD